MFKNIAIISKNDDNSVKDSLDTVISYLDSKKIKYFLDNNSSILLNNKSSTNIDEMKSKCDIAFIIGGDGSMQILKKLAKQGDMKIVAIPKTIDNDVGATESSIGFHTAVDVATHALDNLQSTAASHRRSMILEVMGRDAGHIALNAGIAGGADIILIPAIKYSIDGIIQNINTMKKQDIQHTR